MDQNTEKFIEIGMRETGSTATWYGFNVHLAANMLREAAAMTTQIDGSLIPSDVPGNLAMGIRVPCGVVVGIAPWNAPVILPTRALAMPLACGNTVVLKASEACPATHRLIGAILNEAGLGEGVVNVITHAPQDAPQVVERLIEHPAVKRINFTGSTKVGKIIAETAAKHLKPVLLELGGKAPVVILNDADLDEAVNAVAFGAFFNQGQICMSTERVLVQDGIADRFIEKLIQKQPHLKQVIQRSKTVCWVCLKADAQQSEFSTYLKMHSKRCQPSAGYPDSRYPHATDTRTGYSTRNVVVSRRIIWASLYSTTFC